MFPVRLQASPTVRLGPHKKECLFSHNFFGSLANEFDWTGIRNKTAPPPSFNADIGFIDIFDTKKQRKQDGKEDQLLDDDNNLFSNF